jgi:hypothetical protein
MDVEVVASSPGTEVPLISLPSARMLLDARTHRGPLPKQLRRQRRYVDGGT